MISSFAADSPTERTQQVLTSMTSVSKVRTYPVYVFAILLMVLCLIALPGCGNRTGGRSSGRIITLNFWNGFTGPDGKTMEKIVRQFNAEHPNIQVRMQIIPWNTYYDKVTLSLAYGGAPEVFILHASRLPEYADSEAVSRVDDLVAGLGSKTNDWTPRAWAAAHWKGRQYAVPLDCHPIGMYYNTDLFKKAGIVDANGNAKPPTTLTEFLTDAKKLTKDTDGDGRTDQWGYIYTWMRTNAHTFLAQDDASWLSKDARHSGLSSPEAYKAFGLMTDLIHKYKVCPSPEGQDAWIGFRTGKVAMVLEGIYMLSSLEERKDLKFAGAPCPVFGKHPAVWGDSHMLVMPKNLTPERRQAAWAFINYLSDHSLEWSKGGQIPVRKSILSTPEFRKLPVQYQFSKELPYVVYLPSSTATNQLMPFCDAAVEAILNDIKPTKDALDEASRRINNVLERP